MTSELKTLRISGLVGGFIIAIAVLVFLAAPTSALVKIVSDGFPLLLSICGALFSYALLRRQVKTRLGTRIWGAMTLGLVLWALGEAIWTYYELVLQQETPYPSLADVLWTIGYIPLILSIAFQFLSLRSSVSSSSKFLIAVVLAVMIGLILWLVVAPILTDPEAGSPVEVFFSLAYPIGDIILISFGVALVAAFLGGKLALSWGAIAAGIILLSIADLLFSYGSWNGLYYPDGELNFLSGLFDTLYISAYVVWTIGLFLRLRLPEMETELEKRTSLPEKQGSLPDSDLLGQIVRRAQELEKDQRTSGAEDPLRVYVYALIGLLEHLVSHAGGAGVESALDSVLTEKARQMGCDCEFHQGRAMWKGPPPSAEKYVALLEEAIRYSKSVVSTKTIDRMLQEIEKHMPSRVVQAAEENRLRMVRWLDEKTG
jgi:hypothetical protein